MMFHTRRSLARTLDTAARADWRLLATKHHFQETLLTTSTIIKCL